VRTARGSAVNLQWNDRRSLNGELLVSRLIRDGVQIGEANWFAREQVLIWNIPGVTAGSLTAEQMKAYGGWPFKPDAEWLNLQTFAFYHFKRQSTDKALSRRGRLRRRAPGRSSTCSSPRRRPTSPAATVLHWLDGTVLRFCCDVHDRCYEKYGCSSQIVVAVLVELDVRFVQRRRGLLFRRRRYRQGPFHPFPILRGAHDQMDKRARRRRCVYGRASRTNAGLADLVPRFLRSVVSELGRAVVFTVALLSSRARLSAPPIGANRSSAARMRRRRALPR
jgi:hypothetical protein